jgi:hypothetical protein
MANNQFNYFITTQDIQSEQIKRELQSRGIPVKVVIRGTNVAWREIKGGATLPWPVDILIQENQKDQAKEVLIKLNLYKSDTSYSKSRFIKLASLAALIISILLLLAWVYVVSWAF